MLKGGETTYTASAPKFVSDPNLPCNILRTRAFWCAQDRSSGNVGLMAVVGDSGGIMCLLRVLMCCVLLLPFGSFAAVAKILPIPAAEQKLASWCWLAAGEMVFRYYRIPNINPAGIYQCGIAAAVFGGPCMYNCAICNVGSGTAQRLRDMLVYYPKFVQQVAHIQAPDIDAEVVDAALSQDDLKDEIDSGRPVVAGISPHSGLLPPGLSEHAVLIVGYENHADTFWVVLNDPFPYAVVGVRDPYTDKGGRRVGPGRYTIAYDTLVDDLRWGNSVSGIDTQ